MFQIRERTWNIRNAGLGEKGRLYVAGVDLAPETASAASAAEWNFAGHARAEKLKKMFTMRTERGGGTAVLALGSSMTCIRIRVLYCWQCILFARIRFLPAFVATHKCWSLSSRTAAETRALLEFYFMDRKGIYREFPLLPVLVTPMGKLVRYYFR